eukprot:3060376-Prymnesium_polylepis.4
MAATAPALGSIGGAVRQMPQHVIRHVQKAVVYGRVRHVLARTLTMGHADPTGVEHGLTVWQHHHAHVQQRDALAVVQLDEAVHSCSRNP